jgi:PhnB protein
MFWGDRHGQIDDSSGHRWNISQHLRDVPHDEIVAAAAQAFAGVTPPAAGSRPLHVSR